MSNRYAAAAVNVNVHNRFAVFEEEEEGVPHLPPAAPVRVPSVRSLPPLPKIAPSGGGDGGGGAAGGDASSGSYGDRLRARKAAGPATTPAAPNLTSQREFPTLGGGGGGGGGAGAAATSEVKWSSGTWASKAHAFAEHDAREKEARAFKARREEMDRTNLVGIGTFRFAKRTTGPTVADYEEEDRLRGLLGANDSYSYDYSYRPAETGSWTPPYPPYDGEGGAPTGGGGAPTGRGDEEEGAGDEERW